VFGDRWASLTHPFPAVAAAFPVVAAEAAPATPSSRTGTASKTIARRANDEILM
jgi:hypothetical protein